MKLTGIKTSKYKTFSSDAKKYLNLADKKIISYHINSNIKQIKSMINIFNKKKLFQNNKNNEIIEINARFKKYMDKYYDYKKFFEEKDKHKIKKKSKSTIDLIVDNYIQKGYKIPNLHNNIFHVNPLTNAGKTIQRYFDEYIKKNKKLVSHQEKNFYYLYKLQDCIKSQKYKEKKDMQMILNLSNYNSKNSNAENKIINTNYHSRNQLIKNYYNSIYTKKRCLSEKENLAEKESEETENNKSFHLEQDETFKKLNEYEQNGIRQLIKENEEIKKYKEFIENALKDKKYFNIIDSDNIEINKIFRTMNSIKNNTKRIFQLKLNNNDKNNNDNKNNNLDESLNSSENDGVSNIKNDEKRNIMNKKKKLSMNLSNKNVSNYKLFTYLYKKNNIGINKKNITEKDSEINMKNMNKNDKKLSFSKNEEELVDSISNIKRSTKTRKTQILPGYEFLKKFQFSGKKMNKTFSRLEKERSLNYLFNQINKGTIPNKKFLSEYKKYFSKNKNMNENDLNEFINRDYEPKDFYNLVNSVDAKIKSSDIENKWRKNYLKMGMLEERKSLLDEEKKQDYFINHLLQYFILAKYGKIKLYEFQ